MKQSLLIYCCLTVDPATDFVRLEVETAVLIHLCSEFMLSTKTELFTAWKIHPDILDIYFNKFFAHSK